MRLLSCKFFDAEFVSSEGISIMLVAMVEWTYSVFKWKNIYITGEIQSGGSFTTVHLRYRERKIFFRNPRDRSILLWYGTVVDINSGKPGLLFVTKTEFYFVKS